MACSRREPRVCASRARRALRLEPTPDEFGVLASVQEVVRNAVISEREACARLAEGQGVHLLAASIRERLDDEHESPTATDELAARLEALEKRIEALEGKD